MKRGLFLGVLVAFALAANTASAQVYNWTGAYVGTQVGGGGGRTEWEFVGFGTNSNHHISGVLGGGHLGYNQQLFNSFVLGVETEMNGSDIDGQTHAPNPTFINATNLRWLGSTRVRFGLPFHRFLLYVPAGVAYGSWHVHSSPKILPGQHDYNVTRAGWTTGAGVSYAITDTIIARAEYAFYHLNDSTNTIDAVGDVPRTAVSVHTGRVGVSWKFWTP